MMWLLLSVVALAAPKAVLPLTTQTRNVPYVQVGMQDPSVRVPADDGERDSFQSEVATQQSDLSRAQGERRLELLAELVKNLAGICYYAEQKGEQSGTCSEARRAARDLAKLTKSKKQKAWALFHAKGKAEKADLSPALKLRLDYADALTALRRGDSKAAAKIIAIAPRLGALGAVGADLVAARHFAGISNSGARTGRPADSRYRVALARAAKSSVGDKTKVFEFAVGVWGAAEKGDYSRAPFNMKLFIPHPNVAAILERTALKHWEKGDFARARKTYVTLAENFAQSPQRAPLDIRVIELDKMAYGKNGDPLKYQQTLVNYTNLYQDENVLGSEGKGDRDRVLAAIVTAHRQLVQKEIAGSGKNLNRAVRVIDNYILLSKDPAEQENLRATVAGLHAKAGNHSKAVEIYLELAEAGKSDKALVYIKRAIDSQRVLAKWPDAAPWGGVKAGAQSEREKLLALLQKLPQGNWTTLAHIGLLEISLGRSEAAFDKWRPAMEQEPRSPHAAQAAGLMLTTYDKVENWDALEKTARLARDKGVVAEFRNKRLNLTAVLARALLEGGKRALDKQDFTLATQKLEEFAKMRPAPAEHDEGLALLPQAQWGEGKYQAAITTSLEFASMYPRSRYRSGVLLRGGDWSSSMAFEENSLFFYHTFVTENASLPESTRVRDTLIELYGARGLFDGLFEALKAKSQDRRLDQIVRNAALHQLLVSEDRNGDRVRAVRIADELLKRPQVADELRADAYLIKGRYFATKGNFAEVSKLVASLNRLSPEVLEVRNAAGELQFSIAEAYAKNVSKEVFNLELKDPGAELDKLYSEYGKVRSGYNAACVHENRYCAPAMHSLARLTEKFVSTIEDITIVESLATEVVNKFNVRKAKVLGELVQIGESADDKALASVRAGHTDPDWALQVLWQNSSDWDFDRVSGVTGNAYLDWRPNSVSPAAPAAPAAPPAEATAEEPASANDKAPAAIEEVEDEKPEEIEEQAAPAPAPLAEQDEVAPPAMQEESIPESSDDNMVPAATEPAEEGEE